MAESVSARDIVERLGVRFVVLKSSGVFVIVYLDSGLITDATPAEIELWEKCKELLAGH